MSNRKYNLIAIPLLAAVVAAAVVVTYLMNFFGPVMNQVFGRPTTVITDAVGTEDWDADYYDADSIESPEAVEAEAREMSARLGEEGFVLLKNESSTLPISTSDARQAAISVFGWSFAYPVSGGAGSGGTGTENALMPLQSLTDAGFDVNPELIAAYEAWSAEKELTSRPGRQSGPGFPGSPPMRGDWQLPEMPVGQEQYAQAEAYSSTALVWLSRDGGEGTDLPMSMGELAGLEPGSMGYNPDKHFLELTDAEEELIAQVKQDFETVLMVINTSNAMEIGSLQDDPSIDAILWVGGGGDGGFRAVGEILAGTVNPSGRMADTYPRDLTADPTYVNFGDRTFLTSQGPTQNNYLNATDANTLNNYSFTNYEEGIYVGYRYYETAYTEAENGNYPGFDYDQAVVYPFGYGLSYSTFDQEIASFDASDESISISVTVTNTGDAAGKEVVEVYYTPPYVKGGIEKSAVNLVEFGKTEELAPGASATVSLAFKTEDMASYDAEGHQAYVLDEGDYEIKVMRNAHEMIESRTYTLDDTIIFSEEGVGARSSDQTAATNAFSEQLAAISPEFTVMSRADFAGTFPEFASETDRTAPEALIAKLQKYDYTSQDDPEAELPITGADNGIQLINLRGLDYDDPLWEEFLDQFTVDEMMELTGLAGFGSLPVERLGLPQAQHSDGPIRLSASGLGTEATTVSLTSYPSEVVMASTWNKELLRELGEIIGRQSLANGVQGWYAPGANMHRSAFAGRNFEYFSEDSLLAGKLVTEEISGVGSSGLIPFMKHFAMNDQEAYRNSLSRGYLDTEAASHLGLLSWADEQTIREIYLKPWELAVKNATAEVKYISDDEGNISTTTVGAASGVMSSYNYIGDTWAGGSSALLKTVLRDEWGFKGAVVTDAAVGAVGASDNFMDIDQMIRNGGDLLLTTAEWQAFAAPDGATTQQALRTATHNYAYALVHSNAMNNVKPSSTVTQTAAPWETALLIGDIVIGLLVAFGIWRVIRRNLKHRSAQVVVMAESSAGE
ncbi:MAG: glycoside hydrolase family 3 C-terminal domain-containing protein [Bifidobacteriaceae bacterium]|nr:glycoside hydrolase family 3 C-terminal domain-containing protein [Bifidobacteriaceae bacterium]